MWTKFRNTFAFHISDIAGLLIGLGFIYVCSNTELFYVVLAPQLYLVLLLVAFLVHSWAWLLMYHGESAYMKQMFGKSFKDFLRLTLATISTIGVYFLTQSVF